MTTKISQELRDKIRKSLPLKIFERRQEAREIESSLKFSKTLLSKLLKIETNYADPPTIEFSGKDFFGNTVNACAGVRSNTFRRFRDDFVEMVKEGIKKNEKALAEIPNAKIIPFDFRKKEVESSRMLWPERREEPRVIIRGAWNICKAAGIDRQKLTLFVKEKDLPAFKIPGRKFWFAFPDELEKWKEEQGGGNHD